MFGGGPNLYGYALNDPVQFIDPDGTQRRSMIRVPPPTAEDLGLPNANEMPGATGPTRPGDFPELFENFMPDTEEEAELAVRFEILKKKKNHVIENQLSCGQSVSFTICYGHTGGVWVPGSVSVSPSEPVLSAPGNGLGVGAQRGTGHRVCWQETLAGGKACSCALPSRR